MSCRVRSRSGDDMMKPSPFRTTPPAPASYFRRLGIQGFVAFVTERRLLDYSSLIIGCLVAFASAIVSAPHSFVAGPPVTIILDKLCGIVPPTRPPLPTLSCPSCLVQTVLSNQSCSICFCKHSHIANRIERMKVWSQAARAHRQYYHSGVLVDYKAYAELHRTSDLRIRCLSVSGNDHGDKPYRLNQDKIAPCRQDK